MLVYADLSSDLPSLRWGERIETCYRMPFQVNVRDLPSLRWGERIETNLLRKSACLLSHISPHFGGGSGLKPHHCGYVAGLACISPHFGGGSGLKHVSHVCLCSPNADLPSLRWGERIETFGTSSNRVAPSNLPSLRWGERIETSWVQRLRRGHCYLPSLRWGERIETGVYASICRQADISPHFGGGSGLKPQHFGGRKPPSQISPHFGGGSGLKHYTASSIRGRYPDLPSLRWGERIETSRELDLVLIGKVSPLTSVGGAD